MILRACTAGLTATGFLLAASIFLPAGSQQWSPLATRPRPNVIIAIDTSVTLDGTAHLAASAMHAPSSDLHLPQSQTHRVPSESHHLDSSGSVRGLLIRIPTNPRD